jgi:hypothetical protein
MPALAIWASSLDFTPLTPTAPAAVDQHRHAAFEHALDFRGAQEGRAALVDHLFVDDLAAAQCGGAGLGRGDVGGQRAAPSRRYRPSRWPPSSTTAMLTAHWLRSASARAADRMVATSAWLRQGLVYIVVP